MHGCAWACMGVHRPSQLHQSSNDCHNTGKVSAPGLNHHGERVSAVTTSHMGQVAMASEALGSAETSEKRKMRLPVSTPK